MKEEMVSEKISGGNELQILPKTGDDSVFNIIHLLPVAQITINNQVRKSFDLDQLAQLAQ